jgi:hypothetical protein
MTFADFHRDSDTTPVHPSKAGKIGRILAGSIRFRHPTARPDYARGVSTVAKESPAADPSPVPVGTVLKGSLFCQREPVRLGGRSQGEQPCQNPQHP